MELEEKRLKLIDHAKRMRMARARMLRKALDLFSAREGHRVGWILIDSKKRGSNWQGIKSEMWEEGEKIGDIVHIDLYKAEIMLEGHDEED
jgi:hypothetical protein